jgi:hypothetical protein
MKKNVLTSVLCSIIMLLSQLEGKAQLKLIHYWNFNATTPCSGAGGINLSPIAADYTKSNGQLIYNQVLTPLRDSIIDNGTGGSTINRRTVLGADDTTACGQNLYVRTRNPSSEGAFILNIPTTNYKNILITYAAERSGSGPLTHVYSYSLDGVTFINTGLTGMGTTLPDSNSVPTVWGQLQLDFSSITGANNNPKFAFRIQNSQQNATLNGNDRYDNITVEGDTSTANGIAEINTTYSAYTLYPNPAKDNLFVSGNFEGTKSISIYNAIGQMVYTTEQNKKQVSINTTQLENGVYFVTIKELNGKTAVTTLKFIKSDN